ncbi:hypothetical protein [Streptomyces sp. NPDC057740]|uniref:hypothetical protein n=1 Tax=Streptomyces sp. NPDC057740 TaxID=3346234 RepID=UPI0036A01320
MSGHVKILTQGAQRLDEPVAGAGVAVAASGHARDSMSAPTEWASMPITVVRAARWSASSSVSLGA